MCTFEQDETEDALSMLTKLLLKYLRVLARHSVPEEPMHFWEEIGRAKRVLVALPSSPDEVNALKRVVGRLVRVFTPGDIAFIALQGQQLPSEVEQSQTIQVSPDALRFKRFPRQGLRAQVKARHADAFIDLHCDFDLMSAALAVASGARVRICLAHEQREPFFNLEVRTAVTAPPARRYERLVKLLESWRAAKEPATLPPAGTR